jgi:predicted RND superfamily exporter protein
LQMNTTAYLATLITFVVFFFTAIVAGQIIFWFACVGIALIFTVILGFTCRERHNYRERIRKIDRYVEDFRAGKSLPPVATLCGLKEKKS